MKTTDNDGIKWAILFLLRYFLFLLSSACCVILLIKYFSETTVAGRLPALRDISKEDAITLLEGF